jgi:hypothetical protein
MLSSDYIDRTNDGTTIDDKGAYYNFKYNQVYSKENPYKWRFPMYDNSASADKGLLGSELDNLGHYTYGEKEVWYIQSIESKNLVAEFILEDRKDLSSISNENGGYVSSKSLKCLKFIKLYNRDDRMKNGITAVPLQIIEFDYSYELCTGLPSSSNSVLSQTGKLTLKSIKSYTGKSSEKGLYNYKFGILFETRLRLQR